jgi:hypothetical protein
MAPDLSNEAWVQIRYDYEHTGRPIADICAEHGISSGTLRDRMRRWNWTRRRAPIPPQGPPPAPEPDRTPPPVAAREFDAAATSLAPAPENCPDAPSVAASPPPAAGGDTGAPDDGAIVPRLQGAVARVLPAIEAAVARLAAAPAHPHEMERAARSLAALTRSLRELNGLLAEHRPPAAADDNDDMPEDIEAFRFELARRIDAFVASRTGEAEGDAGPQQT